MSLAPIGISVYTRKDHFKRSICALAKNELAKHSHLYIFSDAPRPGDENEVAEIRAYAKSVTGFKRVVVVEREFNDRVLNNRGGMEFLLGKYGRFIWLEDDVVSAPGFLGYMNEALERYKNEQSVFSVSAYCPPINSAKYLLSCDVFFLKRFNAWGFGIWEDRYRLISSIDPDLLDKKFQRKLSKVGYDVPAMVKKDLDGSINALDVRAMFWQNVYDAHTVYPKNSLTQNIGFDGSGIHCMISDKFTHNELWDKTENFSFPSEIYTNNALLNANRRFRAPAGYGKLLVLLPESVRRLLKRLFLKRHRRLTNE